MTYYALVPIEPPHTTMPDDDVWEQVHVPTDSFSVTMKPEEWDTTRTTMMCRCNRCRVLFHVPVEHQCRRLEGL